MKLRIVWFAVLGSISLFAATGCSSSPRHPEGPPVRREPVVIMRGESAFFAGALRVEATVSQVRAMRSGARGPDGGGGRHHGGFGGGPGGHPGGDGSGPGMLPGLVGPALTLRVRLENTSREPLDVGVRDVASELGSFAVRPERVMLAPGQAAELDPMVSQLGVASAQIPVTIVLRYGGKSETQVVTVKALTADQP